MRVGIDLAQHQLGWDELLGRARFAEELNFDGAWVFDHFKALYGDPGGPCFEAYTLLGALAAVTTRIRLGALVTGVTYRHPSILAAEAVTIDHVSGGRLELSLGASWYENEHIELGIPFPSTGERVERLEEGLLVVKALLTTDGATVEGRHYQLRDATYRPRPVQRPHPPLWIGAGGERRTIPIAARHADVWHAFGSVDALRRKSQVLEEHARRAGRDPADIGRATNLSLSEPWSTVRSTALAVRDAGFTYLVASWPEEGRPRVEEFAERLLPELLEA
ncbi:MAG TPA: TIGR03560 family F420-dependent LLM class oxidoreductase [Acidimicrobiales bacterium]|nr:TIGR03560 family F420-dependent LLM class oxidoreductase [Acidimicrobiales bacterium]